MPINIPSVGDKVYSNITKLSNKIKEKDNQSKFRKIAIPVIAGAHIGDMATTAMALGRPGFREANPYMQTPLLRYGAKPAIMGLYGYALDKYAKKHPKIATGLAIASSVVPAWATIHNANLIRKNK